MTLAELILMNVEVTVFLTRAQHTQKKRPLTYMPMDSNYLVYILILLNYLNQNTSNACFIALVRYGNHGN